MEVKCGRCGRVVKNLKTAHEHCGEVYGPGCAKKMEFFSPEEPEIKGHNGEPEKEYESIHKERTEEMYKKRVLSSEELKQEREKTKALFQERYQDIYLDLFDTESVFSRPAHPAYLKSVITEDLVYLKRPKSSRGGIDKVPKKLCKDQDLNEMRAVHCFGKLFEDPTLSSKALSLYRSMNLELSGFCQVEDEECGGREFGSMIVSSKNENARWDRYVNIIATSRGIHVQLLLMVGKNLDVVMSYEAGRISAMKRITNEIHSIDQTLMAVLHHWFTVEFPADNEYMIKAFPGIEFIDAVKHLSHLKRNPRKY